MVDRLVRFFKYSCPEARRYDGDAPFPIALVPLPEGGYMAMTGDEDTCEGVSCYGDDAEVAVAKLIDEMAKPVAT